MYSRVQKGSAPQVHERLLKNKPRTRNFDRKHPIPIRQAQKAYILRKIDDALQ